MTLWLVIGGMTAAAVVMLLWPLVHKRRRATPRGEYDLAVYRAQLGELRADLDRGILSPEEESGARLEVQRRVLTIDQAREGLDDNSGSAPTAMLAALMLIVLPALAVGLYVWRGSPDVPTQTATDRAALGQAAPSAESSGLGAAVEKLAERLEREPDDLEGWQRLARSYDVLGEVDKAADARARGETLRQSGAANVEPTDGPTGPDAEDVAAATEMTPEEREGMIRGMVEGLAARLETNPNDADGWLRLARSYEVLGEGEAARGALRQAAELRPDDIQIQSSYATALLRKAEPDAPLPPAAIEIYRHILELDPGHADALFFTGLAAARDGHTAAAMTAWTRLLDALEPGSPAHDEVSRRVEELGAGP